MIPTVSYKPNSQDSEIASYLAEGLQSPSQIDVTNKIKNHQILTEAEFLEFHKCVKTHINILQNYADSKSTRPWVKLDNVRKDFNETFDNVVESFSSCLPWKS